LTKTDALVQKFRDLNVWRRGDERAPHKPLLALYALGQVQSGAERLIPFDQLEGPLERLLEDFGPPRKSPHPELPFYRNRALGSAGEEFVVDLERRRLAEAHRPELARCVRWVAREEGDGAGYDVLSFDDSSQPRLIEVKTTNGSARTPFYLSRNECEVASEKPDQWRIYRVHLFASEPRVFTVAPPLDRALRLRAEVSRSPRPGTVRVSGGLR
jgi:hypothetical protein